MNDIAIIWLNKDKFALVDAEDYKWINQWKWWANWKGYAVRYNKKNKTPKTIRMHRIINKTPKGLQTDHKNGYKFDNRKSNLRDSTNTQNCHNRSKRKNCSSIYKGVWWNKTNKGWYTGIRIKNKLKYLGTFKNEKIAAKAYNKEAIKIFGEFAKINEI